MKMREELHDGRIMDLDLSKDLAFASFDFHFDRPYSCSSMHLELSLCLRIVKVFYLTLVEAQAHQVQRCFWLSLD